MLNTTSSLYIIEIYKLIYITTYTVLSFIPVVTIPFKNQYKDFTVSPNSSLPL